MISSKRMIPRIVASVRSMISHKPASRRRVGPRGSSPPRRVQSARENAGSAHPVGGQIGTTPSSTACLENSRQRCSSPKRSQRDIICKTSDGACAEPGVAVSVGCGSACERMAWSSVTTSDAARPR